MKLFNWRRSRGGTYRVRVLCWNCDGYVQVRVAQGTPMGGAVVACPKCGVSGTLATGSIWLSAGENAKAPPPEPKHPIPREGKRTPRPSKNPIAPDPSRWRGSR